MSSSAGCSSLALHTDDQKESSDDRPACLENPRPAGAESTLTENVASPFQAEPRHLALDIALRSGQRMRFVLIWESPVFTAERLLE
jgi:hypothetical protein